MNKIEDRLKEFDDAVLDFLIHLRNHVAGGRVDAEDIHNLFHKAAKYQQLQVQECNHGLTDDQKLEEERLEKQIRDICNWYELPVRMGGDPRGFTVKVFFRQKVYNSWGGKENGWGIRTEF